MDQASIIALQRAARSFSQGRLADADSACRRLLASHGDAVDVLHLLALVRRKSGDSAAAEKLLGQCLALDPQRAEIHANLANLLTDAGRAPEAEASYRDALSRDPDFRPARLGLARLLNRHGAFDAARQEAEILITRDEQDAEAWSVAGTAQQGSGNGQQAEAALRRALAIKPQYGMARHRLGALLGEMGRSEEALAALELACADGVRGPEIDFARASTLMALYRFDDAERLLSESIRGAPRQVATQRLLSRIRFMRGAGDFSDEFAAAVHRYPEDVVLRVGYSQALRGAGQLQEAAAILQEALALEARDPRLFAELAAVCQQDGKFACALRHARSALELAPDDIACREVSIDPLLSLGRAAEALPVIRSLRRRNALNQWYLAMEATALRLLRDPAYAEYCDYDHFVRSFELAPPPGWSDIESFHRELIPVLKARHRFRAEPLDQSLRFGTQTPRSLLGDPDPVIQAFLHALDEPIAAYRQALGFAPEHPFRCRNRGVSTFKGCWSVLLHRNGFHVNHVHTEGWISSAYYVDVPPEVADEKLQSGWLKFGEPRFDTPGAVVEMRVQPQPGKLVLFPSYFWHGTTPMRHDGPRLTIAFDVVPREADRPSASPEKPLARGAGGPRD